MPRTTASRIAAAVLAAILVAFTVLTYLSYTAAFTPTETVTVMSPRAGLVMDQDAKVKYRGIQIGKVDDIAYTGDQAKLTLAINSDQMRYLPSNAPVRIAQHHGVRREVGGVPCAGAAVGHAVASRRQRRC